MSDLEDETARGEHAARILSDPLLVEAFTTIAERYETAWKTSPARDAEGRERLWLMRKCLDQVQGHLTSMVETGQMANVQLEERGLSGFLSRVGLR